MFESNFPESQSESPQFAVDWDFSFVYNQCFGARFFKVEIGMFSLCTVLSITFPNLEYVMFSQAIHFV